nr:2605_t:CDS:2 [Entrophospora candida]
MKKIIVKEFREIITDPIFLTASENKIVQHDELPMVNDELSVTLYLKVKSISSNWACIFHKGTENSIRTPGLWLHPNKTTLYTRFSGNWAWDAGIEIRPLHRLFMDRILWHRECSDAKVLFNTGPLHIGSAFDQGFTGEISNFRYFNWRLSAKEVEKNFLVGHLLVF